MSDSASGARWPRVVAGEAVGRPLAELVRQAEAVPWSRAKRLIESGKVSVDGAVVTDPGRRLAAGQSVALVMHAPRPRDPANEVQIVWEDAHLVVIDKPSGISSVPFAAREGGTAMDLLRQAWRRKGLRATEVALHIVHRIDKDTSGLLVFAKSKRAEVGLAAQFRAHTTVRRYRCLAHGEVTFARVESRLVADRGDGLRGSTRVPGQGKRAVTHVEVVERFARASLCDVRLETGKTHQIRIHFAEGGCPLVGETVYIRDFLNAEREPIVAPRLCLHAGLLGFAHPITGEPLRFETVASTFDLDALRPRLGSA